VPLPENPESEPSVALTSAEVNDVDASLRLIATLTDEPELTDVDVTFAVGAVVSMTSALFAASEFAAPGDAKVSVALLPAASVMVPPLSASEFVAT